MKKLIIAAFLLSTASFAHADVAPTCTGADNHRLDFWLGKWQVFDSKGVLHGTNEITPGPGGCGLIEHWQGLQPGNVGTSLNGYEPATEEWTQYWISPNETAYMKGKFEKDGVLRMTGTITYYSSHEVHGFRNNLSPNPDGTLRNDAFEQDPKTGQWSEWFTGYYKKAS